MMMPARCRSDKRKRSGRRRGQIWRPQLIFFLSQDGGRLAVEGVAGKHNKTTIVPARCRSGKKKQEWPGERSNLEATDDFFGGVTGWGKVSS